MTVALRTDYMPRAPSPLAGEDATRGRSPTERVRGCLGQRPRQAELHRLARRFDLFDRHLIARAEGVDHFLDQDIGRWAEECPAERRESTEDCDRQVGGAGGEGVPV